MNVGTASCAQNYISLLTHALHWDAGTCPFMCAWWSDTFKTF